MSNLSIGSSAAANQARINSTSSAPPKNTVPSFSRGAQAEPAASDKSHKTPYKSEPFPGKPELASSVLVNGRIMNQSFARDALAYDIARLANDVKHGKTSEAARRVERMSVVDIGDHLKSFNVDPRLFAQLSKITGDTKLTPQKMQSAVVDILIQSGANRFVQDFMRQRETAS